MCITVREFWKYSSSMHSVTLWYLYSFPSKEPPRLTLSLCGPRKPTNNTSDPEVWACMEVWASVGLCAVFSCPGDWIQPERISLWLLGREYCHPSGAQPGSTQTGAAATILTSSEAETVAEGSWEINWALLISFDVKTAHANSAL